MIITPIELFWTLLEVVKSSNWKKIRSVYIIILYIHTIYVSQIVGCNQLMVQEMNLVDQGQHFRNKME